MLRKIKKIKNYGRGCFFCIPVGGDPGLNTITVLPTVVTKSMNPHFVSVMYLTPSCRVGCNIGAGELGSIKIGLRISKPAIPKINKYC